MLDGDDENCFLGLSKHQVNKTNIQLRHILKALQIFSLHHDRNKATTWREACDVASKEMISEHCGRTIEFWFLTFRKSNCKLPATKQGHHSVVLYRAVVYGLPLLLWLAWPGVSLAVASSSGSVHSRSFLPRIILHYLPRTLRHLLLVLVCFP